MTQFGGNETKNAIKVILGAIEGQFGLFNPSSFSLVFSTKCDASDEIVLGGKFPGIDESVDTTVMAQFGGPVRGQRDKKMQSKSDLVP